jgi:ATP-dependent DNA helicase RecG
MKNINNYNYLLSDLTKLNGVGKKTMEILKKKKVNNIFDLLWRLPKSYTDRSLTSNICDLQIGQVQTIKIIPTKYQFPRIRNLPNKVNCEDKSGKIDCIFFNSYEGYVRKILPLNEKVTISGKIGYYNNRYQITNPTYISKDSSLIETVHNKYSLTEGITEKIYNKIINQILKNLPTLSEWHDQNILKKFDNEGWNDSIIKLHDPKNIGNFR